MLSLSRGRGPARLGYNLDSADLAPGNRDPVCNGSGGHNYQTSNQNQGRLQRYTSLQTVRGKYSALHQESRKYKGPRPRTISKNQVECWTSDGCVSSFSAPTRPPRENREPPDRLAFSQMAQCPSSPDRHYGRFYSKHQSVAARRHRDQTASSAIRKRKGSSCVETWGWACVGW